MAPTPAVTSAGKAIDIILRQGTAAAVAPSPFHTADERESERTNERRRPTERSNDLHAFIICYVRAAGRQDPNGGELA